MEKTEEITFLTWPQAFHAGIKVVGGKGWNLARLVRYGFAVPDGGVLAATAYEQFIEQNGLEAGLKRISNEVAVDNLSGKEAQLGIIRQSIISANLPLSIQEELTVHLASSGLLRKALAVRSSSSLEDSQSASFAGIHDSFLNIIGLDNVFTAIKGCYASLWSPRAVAYRRKMNLADQDVVFAVVIQEMVHAKSSGVAFSCEPRTGREDLVLINANYGLGESVVSGVVEPDEYTLEARTALPREMKIGRKQGMTIAQDAGGTLFIKTAESKPNRVLSDEAIHELGLLCLRTLDTLGEGIQHQDVEWAFDGSRFFLVQARPATALSRYTYEQLGNQPDLWSNANFRDGLPMVVSTLSWSTLRHVLPIMLSAIPRAVGYDARAGIQRVRLFKGRVYLNLSIMQWEFYDALGVTPQEVNDLVGGHQPEIAVPETRPYRGRQGLARLGRMMKYVLAMMRSRKHARASFAKVGRYTEKSLRADCVKLDDREINTLLRDAHAIFLEYIPTYMLASGASGLPLTLLAKQLKKHFPDTATAIANALMSGSANITSAEHGYRLVALAEIARNDAHARQFFSAEPFSPGSWQTALPDTSPFKRAFSDFLTEFGHRGLYESDIINPRWREDPSFPLQIIKNTIPTADLGNIRDRQKETGKKARQEIQQKMPLCQRLLLGYLLTQARRGAELREMARYIANVPMEPLRRIYQDIGRRFVERGIMKEQSDVYHCTEHELESILNGYWDGGNLALIVSERKTARAEFQKLDPPDLIINDALQHSAQPSGNSGKLLAGLGVAAGRAEGRVRLVQHPIEGVKLQQGEVLVAPSTDPGWTPLFLRASAIVMETGGYLSHGAIVAREYGIPAVVNVHGVLKVLTDGQNVLVDGDEGTIELLR